LQAARLQCSLHNWWRNGSFPCRTMDTDRDSKDDKESLTQGALRRPATSAPAADQWEEDGRVKGAAATTFTVQRLREGTPYTTSPSTLSTAPVTVTIRIRPDEGSPSRSLPPSTSRRTERRRRGRRTVARLISDRADGGGPPASDTRSVPYSMPAVTFSFRFGKGQISNVMSSCPQRQVHLDNVSIQLSVDIYMCLFILLVLTCMRFFIVTK